MTFTSILIRIGNRLSRLGEKQLVKTPDDWKIGNDQTIDKLRKLGMKIGEGCLIFNKDFSTEPYLVELGNRVAIAGGVMFLTHDGSAHLLRQRRQNAQHFGRITVGDNTYIGQNSILCPGTKIGANCIIGAGAVVRSKIPDGSVVVGNPGTLVGRTEMLMELMNASPETLDTFHLSQAERDTAVRHCFNLS